MYHSGAVVQGHWQKWGSMVEPSTDAKTSETRFWYQPERAQEPFAVDVYDSGTVERKSAGVRSYLVAVRQVAEVCAANIVRTVPDAISNEATRGTTFLFLPVFAGIGAIVYFTAGSEPQASAILFGVTALIAACMLADARPALRLVLLFAIAFVIGMLSAKLETLRAGTPMLGSEVTTRMTGRVSAITKDAKGGWRITMDVLATERPSLRFGPDRVVVSARKMPRDITVGDGLHGLVHLRPQSGPVRPGNYDFAFYNYYRGIGANGFMLGSPVKIDVLAKPGLLAGGLLTVSNIRQQLTQRILHNIKGEPGDIATSLVTGQRDGISDETNNAMRLSGLSHILSISGFHMALVAAIIIGGLRAVFALFPNASVHYPVKKFAAVIALLGSAFYLMLSGADVAAQRSFVMLAVMLLAVTVDRSAISMRNLAIAACITLAISPHEVLGPGFQMSYSATAALIAFYGWWSRYQLKRSRRGKGTEYGLWSVPSRALNYVGGIAMTSLVAGTASAIFAAYHFNNTAPFGLIGNALALPVVSILVMPFAVLGLLAMPFDLDWLPFAVMGQGIELVIIIAKAVASYSPSGNLGLMPPSVLIFLAIALLLLVFLSTWLRLCALPLLVLAFIVMGHSKEPSIMISEDGKLIALRTSEGNLAINRAVGSAFDLKNWQQGYGAAELIKPVGTGLAVNDTQFECFERVCIAREPGGLVLAYTDDPAKMNEACVSGDIVVLAYAAKNPMCPNAGVLTISKRDLALKGAMEISFHNSQSKSELVPKHSAADALSHRLQTHQVTYAVGQSNRPWNSYRNYSRAARNLPDKRSNEKAGSFRRQLPAGADSVSEPVPAPDSSTQ